MFDHYYSVSSHTNMGQCQRFQPSAVSVLRHVARSPLASDQQRTPRATPATPANARGYALDRAPCSPALPPPSAMHLPARARRAAGAAGLCAGVPAPAGSVAATPRYAATRGWRSAPCRKIALMNSTPAAMAGGRKSSRRCPPRSLRNAKHRVLPLGAARARRARRACRS